MWRAKGAVKINRWYRGTAIAAAVVVLIVALRTCSTDPKLANSSSDDAIKAELTLQTVTLEQPDADGTLLWRLKAKSVKYSPDSQKAELVDLDGEFFQAGKTIYTVTADQGEVQQNGETLFLQGHLVAKSLEDKLTLESERLRWQPKQDLLVMGNFKDEKFTEAVPSDTPSADAGNGDANSAPATPTEPLSDPLSMDEIESSQALLGAQSAETASDFDREAFIASFDPGNEGSQLSFDRSKQAPVIGFTPTVEALAKVVVVSNQDNRVDLLGGVLARSKDTPWMTFASQSLAWFTQREVIEAKQPIKVEQYESKAYETVSDRLIGAKGQVQLAENIVTLENSVQLDQFAQALKVQSEQAIWDVDAQTVALDQPVEIEKRDRQINASANKANLDLEKQIVYLIGDVRARGKENDSRLFADSVTWQTNSQEIEAEGNVSYQQAANPEVSLKGPKAVGNLEQGTVVITGGPEGEVVTEIVPGNL
ncbi:MAG: LPS export ABC transporter periplasmic protein LptC [Phormidesmis priestleyi]|uniref:LPS export ABC transporter periplasmic protein LptC n=1 Tax=Phormidesmis priestleyi TaxID=268141 RepID=A0A2W4XIK8_9CYAN|nr:MAG: LPS export ABC transporter periplasmic protein LptC [Phormidesmis priestleyi]